MGTLNPWRKGWAPGGLFRKWNKSNKCIDKSAFGVNLTLGMTMSVPKSKDPRRKRILENVPIEILTALARSYKAHKLENLTKGEETLLDEVFRLAGESTIQTLLEEFPGPDNFHVWFFRNDNDRTTNQMTRAIDTHTTRELREGVNPTQIGTEPILYHIEEAGDATIFRLAAQDSTQRISTGFGEKTEIAVVNFYTGAFHKNDGSVLIFGPYASSKARSLADELDSTLELKGRWVLVKPKRGKSRELYEQLKHALDASLIETKRLDPSGDYQTVALEARQRHPDLESVPSFRKQYLHAESIYDILEFKCENGLGIDETSHVRFGRPHGRFSFKPRTSMSVIYYFKKHLRELLH